ncbi:MAG: AbrB/MazE/SpoVT family DNA-binding domain-containing protein [Cellvibrionaceae bacterium]|nr:AbrB/MazE/SpoVT family DNA-binding domain-containing protein [Cellvibrionaceae bacterium]
MSIVTTKGQATIPKSVRDFLGITPGKSDVEFVIVGDHVEVINKDQSNPFAAVRGITKGKMTTDKILELTRRG